MLKIAISACLQGCEVRYDGTGKRQPVMLDELTDYELIGFCPEAEAGLGIPRPPIQLVQKSDGHQQGIEPDIRVLQVSDSSVDRTQQLRDCAQAQNWLAQVDGFIFKARSPSCGVGSTPVWNDKNEQVAVSDGEFVRCLRRSYPQLPLIDEEQWRDQALKQEFLQAVQRYSKARLS